jgi:hypothetical protein
VPSTEEDIPWDAFLIDDGSCDLLLTEERREGTWRIRVEVTVPVATGTPSRFDIHVQQK